MEERDKWDKIIQTKLRDFEADTDPGDWQSIAERLPGKKVLFTNRWYYIAAAIILFLLITGGYYYFKAPSNSPERRGISPDVSLIAGIQEIEEAHSNSPERKEVPTDSPAGGGYLHTEPIIPVGVTYLTAHLSAETGITESEKTVSDLAPLPVSQKIQLEVKNGYSKEETIREFQNWYIKLHTIDYFAEDFGYLFHKKPSRKWSFGAGGGSYSVGTNGGGFFNTGRYENASYAMAALNNGEWYLGTPVKRDDDFNTFLTNSLRSDSETHLANISKEGLTHKQPVSLGIGVGYALNDRWSLQSGLVYTLLFSEWKTSLDYQEKFKQQLHFLGVPLGISYKIAEWNKLRFYATTGGMAEWNVGGNIKTKYYYYEEESFTTEKESIRMKEMQWSVNARVGATYPVIRFINVYIEGGTNYYFNNKSTIETIRSDKPFHVSLQAGLRFGL